MKIDDLYQAACSDQSGGTYQHLELLSRLSSLCGHVTEFGVERGASTAALLFGRPKTLISYDIKECTAIPNLVVAAKEIGVDFKFNCENTLKITPIAKTEFLFIDTEHTYAQLQAELGLHGNCVTRYIAFHDVTLFGNRGENGDRGLWPAIVEFVKEDPSWELMAYYTNCYGLAIIKRTNQERPK